MSKTLKFGAKWNRTDDEWTLLSEEGYERSVTYKVVDEAGLTVTITIYPVITTRFYRMVSAYLKLYPDLAVEARIPLFSSDELSKFDVSLAVNGQVGASFGIFSKTLSSWESETFSILSPITLFSLPKVSFVGTPASAGKTGDEIYYRIKVEHGVNNKVPEKNISWLVAPTEDTTITPESEITENAGILYPRALFKTKKEGTYKITASVKGEGFLGDVGIQSADHSIKIEQGESDVSVEIASPTDGKTYKKDESITFSGSAKDADDNSITGKSLVWTANGSEIGTGTSFSKSDFDTGSYTITLTATDEDDNTGTASVSIKVEEDESDIDVTISSPSSGATYEPNETVTCTGSAKDANGNAITGSSLVWTSGGSTIGTGTTVSKSDFSKGTHTITLTATDSDGNTGSASVSIKVEESSDETDITDGTWSMDFDWDCNEEWTNGTLTFYDNADKTMRLSVYYDPPGSYWVYTGTWTQSDSTVKFTIDTVNGETDTSKWVKYTGTVDGKKITGTMKNYKGDSGCWKASK